MTDANTICHDVDLLGDWLDAKGYTEEAGLCLRVLGLIHEQAEENEKLRAVLKPFADEAQSISPHAEDTWFYYDGIRFGDLRAARAAYLGTKNDDTMSDAEWEQISQLSSKV